MPSGSSLRRLLAEIDSDRAALRRHLDLIDRASISGRSTEGDLARAAWAFHHAYGAVEGILVRVARTMESRNADDDLDVDLDSATLALEGIRPALLRTETARALHDLRAFRDHARHAYAAGLDPERLAGLQEHVRRLRTDLERDLDGVESWLSEVADAATPPPSERLFRP